MRDGAPGRRHTRPRRSAGRTRPPRQLGPERLHLGSASRTRGGAEPAAHRNRVLALDDGHEQARAKLPSDERPVADGEAGAGDRGPGDHAVAVEGPRRCEVRRRACLRHEPLRPFGVPCGPERQRPAPQPFDGRGAAEPAARRGAADDRRAAPRRSPRREVPRRASPSRRRTRRMRRSQAVGRPRGPRPSPVRAACRCERRRIRRAQAAARVPRPLAPRRCTGAPHGRRGRAPAPSARGSGRSTVRRCQSRGRMRAPVDRAPVAGLPTGLCLT